MTSTTTVLATVVLLSSTASAQQYVISTYAGGAPPLAAPAQGMSVSIGAPISVATDEKGNVYFASPDLNAVFKLDASGILTRIAGSSRRGYSGDGGPATEAQLNLIFGNPAEPSSGLAIDKAGNLFIADTSNQCVRRVSPTGIITTMASVVGWALAVDSTGNVFVTYPSNGVAAGATSKISANGTVTTVSSIGGWGLAVDTNGNLFVADGNANVQRISPSGAVTTVAGNGIQGYSGDGGPATSAQLSNPTGVAVDSNQHRRKRVRLRRYGRQRVGVDGECVVCRIRNACGAGRVLGRLV